MSVAAHGIAAAGASGHMKGKSMKARVEIRLKQGVLDPQGKAIESALSALGFAGVGQVRQGKLIEISLAEDDPLRARAEVEEMCRKLLANPVIEDYAIEVLR